MFPKAQISMTTLKSVIWTLSRSQAAQIFILLKYDRRSEKKQYTDRGNMGEVKKKSKTSVRPDCNDVTVTLQP